MNATVIADEATIYQRISKVKARKAFDAGHPIYIIACKMRPGFPFSMGMTIDNRQGDAGTTFDLMLDRFTFYNCTYETGYYPAFYVTSERSKG